MYIFLFFKINSIEPSVIGPPLFMSGSSSIVGDGTLTDLDLASLAAAAAAAAADEPLPPPPPPPTALPDPRPNFSLNWLALLFCRRIFSTRS